MAGFDGGSWADIEAGVHDVFAVVADAERIPLWQPDVKVARALERDHAGRASLVHTELHTVARRLTAVLRLRFDEPQGVSWVMEDGDVKAFAGGWELEELPNGLTRATYSVTIDFGRTLGLLVRGPAGRAAGSAVSSLPGKLKAFVEDHEPQGSELEPCARSGSAMQ